MGFTSAAAVIIATTQIKDILGLTFPGSKFLQVWENLFAHIHETRLWDAVLGFVCMAVLLILRVSSVQVPSPSPRRVCWPCGVAWSGAQADSTVCPDRK